jgi:predicted flap endonuclease-1-like 5' DNA nuclease
MDHQTDAWPKGVAAPAQRALSSAGITRLEQLAGVKESDLRKLHGMGPKALAALRTALEELGLTFAPE